MNLKNIFLIIFLSTVLLSCENENKTNSDKIENEAKVWIDKSSNHYKEYTYFENGSINIEREFKNGNQLILKGYYSTGEIEGLFLFENNVIVSGAEYYKNGQIMGNVPRNLDGKINGIATYYYENGNISGLMEYRQDKPVGNSKDFDLNGKIISEIKDGIEIKLNK